MKHLLFVISIIILHFAFSQFLPYWNVILVCFAMSYFFKLRPLVAFWLSLLAIMLSWGGFMAYSDHLNDGILAQRMAGMFGLQSKWILMLIASFLGGLLAAFAGASGAAFRRMFISNEIKYEENSMNLDEMDDLRPEYKGTKHV